MTAGSGNVRLMSVARNYGRGDAPGSSSIFYRATGFSTNGMTLVEYQEGRLPAARDRCAISTALYALKKKEGAIALYRSSSMALAKTFVASDPEYRHRQMSSPAAMAAGRRLCLSPAKRPKRSIFDPQFKALSQVAGQGAAQIADHPVSSTPAKRPQALLFAGSDNGSRPILSCSIATRKRSIRRCRSSRTGGIRWRK